MKKFFLFVLLVCFCGCFFGCDATFNYVLNNMSDLRINYFEGKNEDIFVNISCGYREEVFNYNGVSTNPVECGVISLEFMNTCAYASVEVTLNVDGEEFEYILEKSPFEDIFMEDIGKILKSDSIISVKLKNQEKNVELVCKSNNFKVDYKQAIKIAINSFSEQIGNYYFNNKLNAECYLKVLAKKDYENIFWYFSIVGVDGKNYSTLIDCYTGKLVVA